jgi:hypothetical protein
VSASVFLTIQAYIADGDASGMWKYSQDILMDLLHQADAWELHELSERCQIQLGTLVTRDTMIDMCDLAQENRWPFLRAAAMQKINERQLGIEFQSNSIDTLKVVFLEYQPSSRNLFNHFREKVTHLGYRNATWNDEEFSETVNGAPRLIGLDLSETEVFGDRIQDIPSSIEELDLSSCSWLDESAFRLFTAQCPQIINLKLSSNLQLHYGFWTALKELRDLRELDLSYCIQMIDADFRLILHACPALQQLSIGYCNKISEDAFAEVGVLAPHLRMLDISGSSIEEAGLVALVTNAPALEELVCPHITAKTKDKILRLRPTLRGLAS